MQPWVKQNNILTGLPLYTEIKMDSYSICVSTRLLINCSKTQVWRFICDVENMDRWVRGFSKTHWVSISDELRVGSLFNTLFSYRGKEHNVGFKITKYIVESTFGFETETGNLHYSSIIDLEEVDGATRLKLTMLTGSQNKDRSFFSSILTKLYTWSMGRQVRKELNLLKKTIEIGGVR